jgi:type II secretory pathway pseudopilin PulG
MKKTLATLFAAAAVLAMIGASLWVLRSPIPNYYSSGTLLRYFTVSYYEKRLADLQALRAALESYRRDHGGYPVSHAWDGVKSPFGESRPDWIPGLAPKYLAALPAFPVDEENTPFENDEFQYLYKSDGQDYKVMAYAPEDCPAARRSNNDRLVQGKICLGYGFWTPGAGDWLPSVLDERLADLKQIQVALEKYRQSRGGYPQSQGFDGLYSRFGYSGEQWIKGLVPEFLDKLPRDPRRNADPANQYLYASDGKDYKLISHSPEDLGYVARTRPELLDPKRTTFAYGYWSAGAADW